MAALVGYASIGCTREGERLVPQLPNTQAKVGSWHPLHGPFQRQSLPCAMSPDACWLQVAGLIRLGLLQKAFHAAKQDPGNRVAMNLVLDEAKSKNDYNMISAAAAALASGRGWQQ